MVLDVQVSERAFRPDATEVSGEHASRAIARSHARHHDRFDKREGGCERVRRCGSQALVDGGLIDNVPADVLAAKGCNFVIAVSVTANLELEFAKNQPDTPTDKMRSASTIQTLLRSYQVQNYSMNSNWVQSADFVIEPDVTGFELTDFVRTDELAAVGEQTTLEAIPQIRELLHKKDSQLFPLTG
jgi:predicted acylesterase/phospholipase RssA